MCSHNLFLNSFLPTNTHFVSLGKDLFCNIYYGFTFFTNQTYLKRCFLQIHCILKKLPVKYFLQHPIGHYSSCKMFWWYLWTVSLIQKLSRVFKVRDIYLHKKILKLSNPFSSLTMIKYISLKIINTFISPNLQVRTDL